MFMKFTHVAECEALCTSFTAVVSHCVNILHQFIHSSIDEDVVCSSFLRVLYGYSHVFTIYPYMVDVYRYAFQNNVFKMHKIKYIGPQNKETNI